MRVAWGIMMFCFVVIAVVETSNDSFWWITGSLGRALDIIASFFVLGIFIYYWPWKARRTP